MNDKNTNTGCADHCADCADSICQGASAALAAPRQDVQRQQRKQRRKDALTLNLKHVSVVSTTATSNKTKFGLVAKPIISNVIPVANAGISRDPVRYGQRVAAETTLSFAMPSGHHEIRPLQEDALTVSFKNVPMLTLFRVVTGNRKCATLSDAVYLRVGRNSAFIVHKGSGIDGVSGLLMKSAQNRAKVTISDSERVVPFSTSIILDDVPMPVSE